MNRPVYLDYNATTPLDGEVRDEMLRSLDAEWGNPSSVHQIGRRARARLDDCRDRVSAVFGCKPSEFVFTSGGTESANLAVFGAARLRKQQGRHLITSAVEHHCVLHPFKALERQEGFEVTFLPVDKRGFVSPDDLRRAIRPETTLVSVMAANNEIGTLQPIAELGAICRERGVLFHTDAVQWFGKEPFQNIDQFNADLVSICAHKLHGPKGSGALYVRSPLQLPPIIHGGSHENERRAGTENLAGIVGLTEVVERFVRTPVFDSQRLGVLTGLLSETLVSLEGVTLVGDPTARLANTLAFVVAGSDSIALLAGLDIEGFCASSGSACSAGSLEPSHVVKALGYSPDLANALVRFSLGRETTREEVERVCASLPDIVRRAQRCQ